MSRGAIDAVVKLGGSLERSGVAASVLCRLQRAAGRGRRLLLVPGGGRFADAVRQAAAARDPGAAAAHWAAVLAMDQLAHLLAGWAPAAVLVAGPDEAGRAAAAGRLAILAPFAWLRAQDPLPHDWAVTSDSIAAWVAGRVRARRLLLLKMAPALTGGAGWAATIPPPVPAGSAGLPAARDAEALARLGIVDAYFARAVPPGLAWRVIRVSGSADPCARAATPAAG